MRLSTISALAFASSTVAEVQFEISMLENNKMRNLMEVKTSHRESGKSEGLFDANRYTSTSATQCANGQAGDYSCENVDLQSHLTHADMGSSTREGNDVWGESLTCLMMPGPPFT